MTMTLDAPAAQPRVRRAFTPPRPNPALMWTLGFVNRWFILRGLPVLRHVPVVRDLPGARGYLRIRLDLPRDHRARLAAAVNPDTAAFLAPNHPEFGADWMIDKEISTFVAPQMASWAAQDVLQSAPAFWAANNLVANDGGDAAMDHSVAWALAGKGVLLHPEGLVRWTSDHVHSLFGGVAEMAIDAARQAGDERTVFIAPIVWKLRYLSDVSAGLHADMRRIERALGLPRGNERSVTERFHALQQNILALQAERFGFPTVATIDAHFFDRQHALQLCLVGDVETRYEIEYSDSIDRRIRRLDRAVRAERTRLRNAGLSCAAVDDDLARLSEAQRLGGFTREHYATPRLSQEQIAESLKRIRAALVRRGVVNTMHNYLPRPYGARVAHVRVPDPIRIDTYRAAAGPDERAAYVAELLDAARTAMQSAVDDIRAQHAAEIDALSHDNPFATAR